jgi:hypothetical protein
VNDAAHAFGALNRAAQLHHAVVQLPPVKEDPRHVQLIIAPAGHPHTLRKRYQWVAVDAAGSPRHHREHEPGTWTDVAETRGVGKWQEVSGFANFTEPHGYEERLVPDLKAFDALLSELESRPTYGLQQGRLRDSERTRPTSTGYEVAKHDRMRYEDAASVWLLIDVDELPVDYDVRIADQEDVAHTIDKHVVPALGDEFEDVSYIVAHTGSAGIKGSAESLRVRLIFQLATPLTLRQQRQMLRAAKKRQPALDAGIYEPERFIASAPPQLTANVVIPTGTMRMDMPRRLSSGTHWIVQRLADVVPNAAPAAVVATAAEALADIAEAEGIATTAVGIDDLLSEVGADGETYRWPIIRLISSLAWRTPLDQIEAEMARWRSFVAKRIAETSTPHRLQDRFARHLNDSLWRDQWRRARDRKAGAIVTSAPVLLPLPPTLAVALGAPAPSATAPITIAGARAQLIADVAAAADEIIDRNRVEHVLVTAPPGFGKTRALRAVVTEARLANRRIVVLVPNHDLAAQVVADLKEHARTLPLTSTFTHDDLVRRVRHHRGRKQPGMCTDKVHGARAARMESIGVSPRGTACADCPAAASCLWLQQFSDDEPGVIVTVHASMMREDYAALSNVDLFVIDEDAGSVFIGNRVTNADKPPIDALSPGKHFIRRAGMYAITAEWRASRELLQQVLRAALPNDVRDRTTHVVATATASPLLQGASPTIGVAGSPPTGTRLERALDLESAVQQDALARLKGERVETHETRRLMGVLSASRDAEAIYRGIKASAARQRVFALRVFRRGIKDAAGSRRHQDCFWVETRRPVPPAILAKGALWLNGTAEPAVWQATLANGGQHPATRIIGAPAAPAVSDLTVHQYIDRMHAKASYLGATPAADDVVEESIEHLEQEASAAEQVRLPAWMMWSYPGPAPAVAAAVKRYAAQQLRHQRATRKLRADAGLARLRRFILMQALPLHRGAAPKPSADVLVVAQKAVVEQLRALGLPPNVDCAHFGALRGLNRFRDVKRAIVVGRPALSNDALEMLTEALHMHDANVREVARSPVWATGKGVLETRSGPVEITTEQHPDAYCAALARTITQAEVVQAVARIRPYDRGPRNPCEIHVFGQHPTGLTVDTVACWSDADVPWWRVAMANGALFERPETNQAVYSDLVAAAGRGGDESERHRGAWIEALAGLAPRASTTPQLAGGSPYNNGEGKFGDPKSGIPASCAAPEILSGSGLALAQFTLARTSDGTKPQKQHVLLSSELGPAYLQRVLGGRLADFRWLPATAAMGLLYRAFEKRANKAIAAGGWDAPLFQEALAGTRDWRQVAREVLGWAV